MTASPLVGSTFFGIDISRLGDQLTSIRRRISKRVLIVEFGSDLLQLAEACLMQQGVQLNHISSVVLPPDALDRGVPAEPKKMATLLQQICNEKKIPAHRVAVVLPPEVAFQRLVELPQTLTLEEARDYVLDPGKGVQLPFPLAQTDFDLVPMSAPSIEQQVPGTRLYMLSAVPARLVDQVIEMLQLADLELQLLELGSLSQLRCLASDLVRLAPHEAELVLELRSDCSNLMLVTCSGLLASERLSAIRDFPQPVLDEEQTIAALEAGLSAESITLQDDSYLPISDLDLRALVADFQTVLSRFNKRFPAVDIRCLQLTGLNSAHPMLVDLLQEALGLKVLAHRPLLADGVSGFSADGVLVQAGLARLVGLALGLLNQDQFLSSPFDISDKEKSSPSPGHVITELLDLDTQISEDGLVSVRNQDAIEAQEVQISAWQSLADVEVSSQVEAVSETPPQKEHADDSISVGSLDLFDQTNQDVSSVRFNQGVGVKGIMEEVEVKDEEEWPSIEAVRIEGVMEEVEVKDEEVCSSIEGISDQLDAQEGREIMDSDVNKDVPQCVDDIPLVMPDLEFDTNADDEKKPLNVPIDSEESTGSEMESLGELRFADND